MDELITNEINQVLNPPGQMTKGPTAPLFTWLSYMDRNEGVNFFKKYSKCLLAKNIKDTPADLESFNYEKVENVYLANPRERLERRTSDQFVSQLAKILTLCDSNFE